MNPQIVSLLVSLLMEVFSQAKKHYESLPPEEKEAWHGKFKDWQEQIRNMPMPSPTLEGP